MNKNWWIAVSTIVCLTWSVVSSEIPQIISYQGKITESGQPVADGSYTMRFRIYTAPSSGTLRWDSGNQTVQVTGGIFSILLGESGQPTLDLSFDEDLWVLVTFEGDDQNPRQRIASVGYSYMASGIVPGTEVSGAVTSGTNAALSGENTATTGALYGVIGKTNSSFGAGVWGSSENPGSDLSYGVKGSYNADGEGAGVYGEATATSPGANPSGVSGIAWATSGNAFGGRFTSQSTSGRGVFGEASATTGTTYGVYGSSNSSTGYGVYGENNATVGATYGIYGTVSSSFGAGVWGKSENPGADLSYGVKGSYNADGGGAGIHGEATVTSPGASPSGVSGIAWATSGTAYGGKFESQSTSGRGVYGRASALSGITYGVAGESNSTSGYGVYGRSVPSTAADAIGVVGQCDPGDYYGIGVTAVGTYRAINTLCSTDGSNDGSYFGGYLRGQVSGSTGIVYGVYGYASGGASHYGVYYSGGINGSGVMRNTVRTDDGPVSLYVQQATENWFEDFGSGIVRNGSALISMRKDYMKTITSNEAHPVKVFVTPTAQLGEWWVDKDSHGFTLIAPEAPDGASFDYRIVGKRKDAEELRLESTPSGYTDTSLYPDDASVPAEYLRERRKSERAQESDFE